MSSANAGSLDDEQWYERTQQLKQGMPQPRAMMDDKDGAPIQSHVLAEHGQTLVQAPLVFQIGRASTFVTA